MTYNIKVYKKKRPNSVLAAGSSSISWNRLSECLASVGRFVEQDQRRHVETVYTSLFSVHTVIHNGLVKSKATYYHHYDVCTQHRVILARTYKSNGSTTRGQINFDLSQRK